MVDYHEESLDNGQSMELANLKRREASEQNFSNPISNSDKIHLFGTTETEKTSESEGEGADDSPYPEVRAAVPPTDDPSLPVNTIRMWVLGLSFVTLGSGLNMLFDMRAPSIYISYLVAQLLSHWCGQAWYRFMPSRQFNTFGLQWSLNPSPWNIKEHAVVTIMANASFATAYANEVLVSQQHYYGQNFGWIYKLLLVWSTQIIGYGLAGAARKYLVWPSAAIWPNCLVSATLFHTLHNSHDVQVPGWNITRRKLFLYVFLGGFLWYFVPGYLAPFLSVFAFVTWIRPNNVVVNQLFGGYTGLSLIPITFDWTQIAGYIGSPLIPPWYATANILAGTISLFIILPMIVHYSGAWYSAYLPMSDSTSYDNMQNVYNVTKILTPEFTLDVTKYKSYSPLFLSTTFALAYGVSFAAIASTLSHTALWHGKEIWARYKEDKTLAKDDIHMRLMRKYPEVPDWWYYIVFVTTVAMSLVVTQVYDTKLSWWAFFLAISISVMWFLPLGFIQATTNIGIGLNVITEFIIGYLSPGKPVAMMCFKTYGYITMSQGMAFVSDLKLGHYMKIPPRTLFWAQTIATVWASLVEVSVMNWALGTIRGICTKQAQNGFTCPGARVFYTASVIWGLLGPARIFSPGQVYQHTLWFFGIGLLAPIPFWWMAHRRPNSFWRYVNMPVFFGGTGYIPPATPLNYLSFCIVGYIFNKMIRQRYPSWWSKFNFVVSAALDSGLAISTIFVFFTLGLSGLNGGSMASWWGTNIAQSTLDASGSALQKTVADGEFFGPKSW